MLHPPVVVMGVQGSGKSTIAELLASRTGGRAVDGDRLHPADNVARMAAGVPLSDADREPWLRTIGDLLDAHRGDNIVVVCSALRRNYRDLLRDRAPGTVFVHLSGSFELISERVDARTHEYMPPALLRSQFASLEPLEPDEDGIVIDVAAAPVRIVDEAVAFLDEHARRVSGGAASSR
ncbi:gluconokinase [Microbacterium pseudoresistens]|uniref:Gluconokinase n=1 Tax=Microbacterium pseudoresistens TaxID=640634 RepID=A0A7Y9ESH4_9MICO|nr:carbohydrate kinase (thermoresistant glucokinase family) [Microbacterium pseudoresistens]